MNARAGTPKAALDKLYAATTQMLRQPEIKAQFAKINIDIVERTPEVAMRRLGEQARNFAEIAKDLGIQPQ